MIRILTIVALLAGAPSLLMAAALPQFSTLEPSVRDVGALYPNQRSTPRRPADRSDTPRSTPRRRTTASEPRNLGPKVNSYATEILPVISPDGQTLYFVRADHAVTDGGEGDQDIWYSVRDSKGQWTEAVHMGPPLNSESPNGVLSVTPDGNSLLLNGTYDHSSRGFSISNRTADGWSRPRMLQITNYYNNSRYVAAYLTNDARTLLLTIEREDSRGGMDLYYCRLGANGVWSEPVTLGPTLNTPEDENAPFLASDGVTLYFASEGRQGYGSADIYMSRRLDDTWKKWSEPVNLGPTINTAGFESGFYLPASGDSAYYSSSGSGQGATDIFRIELPEFARPKAVVLVAGRVFDKKTGKQLEATIRYETLANGEQVGVARSDVKSGGYKIALPAGAKYGFRAEADGYMAVSDNIDLSNLTRYTEVKRDLYLVPIEVGQAVRLNNLFFDFNEATIRPESYSELARLIEVMKTNANMEIEIAGHTDAIGTAERNRELSRERANAVAEYLASNGISGDRVTVKGYGATKPVASNKTDDGRQQNRRVEVVIKKR